MISATLKHRDGSLQTVQAADLEQIIRTARRAMATLLAWWREDEKPKEQKGVKL